MYLLGLLVSKCIMAGNNLSEAFGVSVLDNYYFWLILFFVCSAILSF